MQKLSKRLEAVANFVFIKNGCIADIGTDHGYLPVYLVQSGQCSRAVAMDVKPGPLERARQHIAQNQLEQLIQVRLSNGFSALKRREADSAVIAGMGGMSVIQILENGLAQLSDIKELVIGAQSDLAKVRKFLYRHRLYIDREELVYEDGKFYPILHASWEKPAYQQDGRYIVFQEELKNKLPDIELLYWALGQYGEYLLYQRHPVFRQMLERDAAVKCQILDSLGKTQQEKNPERRQELERQQKGISAFLAFYN